MSRSDTPTASMTAPVEVERRRGRPRRSRTTRILLGALAVAVALVWVFPVYWMLNSSLLPSAVLEKTTPTLLPFGGSFKNFASVFADGGFFDRIYRPGS